MSEHHWPGSWHVALQREKRKLCLSRESTTTLRATQNRQLALMLPAWMSSKTSNGDIVTHIISLHGDPSLNPWMFHTFFIRFGLPAFSGVLDEHQIHSKSLHSLIADCEQFLVFIIKLKLRFFTANSPCLYHFLHNHHPLTWNGHGKHCLSLEVVLLLESGMYLWLCFLVQLINTAYKGAFQQEGTQVHSHNGKGFRNLSFWNRDSCSPAVVQQHHAECSSLHLPPIFGSIPWIWYRGADEVCVCWLSSIEGPSDFTNYWICYAILSYPSFKMLYPDSRCASLGLHVRCIPSGREYKKVQRE